SASTGGTAKAGPVSVASDGRRPCPTSCGVTDRQGLPDDLAQRPGQGDLGRVVLLDVVDDRAAGRLRGRLGPWYEPPGALDVAVRVGRQDRLGLGRRDRVRFAVLAYPLWFWVVDGDLLGLR